MPTGWHWRPGSGLRAGTATLTLPRTLGGRAAFLPFFALPPFFLIALHRPRFSCLYAMHSRGVEEGAGGRWGATSTRRKAAALLLQQRGGLQPG